jgi:hypothetical protein
MKKLWIAVFAVAAFMCAYDIGVADAFPAAGIYGRAEHRGYFTNVLDSAGTDVFPRLYQSGTEAMPNTINSASEFIAFIDDKYDNGAIQGRTGAAFIMQTMLEINGASADETPSSTAREAWRNVVRTAANHGHVTWRANFSYTINSYYQGGSDDAFYDNSGTFPAMIFEDEFGRPTYVIKWQCANPVGTPTTFNTYTLEQPWDISASSYVVNGAGDNSSSTGGTVNTYVGDTLRWTHRVLNTGSFTNPTQIASWSSQNLDGGPFTTITPRFTIGVMASGASHTYSDPPYIVPNLPAGTNICRTAWYNPTSSTSNADARSPGHCARVLASWDLTPTVTTLVNGVPGNRAEPGDTVAFRYSVNNSGGDSSNTACNIVGLTRTNYYNIPSPIDSVSDAGYAPPAGLPGCPRNFVAGNTVLAPDETIAAGSVVANRSLCRSFFVNPAVPGGSAEGAEACVYVVNKPYARAYGGDVAAGMRFANTGTDTCSGTQGDNAAIIGWNRGSGAGYAGSGAQHGVAARGAIADFASSLGGAAGPPVALSFTNTTNVDTTSYRFGGLFDWAPCLPNYYDEAPTADITTDINVGSLGSGVYSASGDIDIIGGPVDAGEDITIYVTGQIFLSGSITYQGSWTPANMPMFRLIIVGDLYIDNDVSRLDGLYVAQQDASASHGLIVTCAVGRSTPTMDGSLLSTCDNTKLTVNGSLVARHIRMTRTVGTLRQSSAGEASTVPHIAETLNYNPIMWIPQPPSATGPDQYDAITSLPPIL